MASLGFIECNHLSITLMLADAASTHAHVSLAGIEPNGTERITIRLRGEHLDDVQAALDAAEEAAERLGCSVLTHSIASADPGVEALNHYPNVINGIYGAREELLPNDFAPTLENLMNKQSQAIGILETQGFTAMLEATDVMLKAADVELVGKEKIGAAYITVIVCGDVAAVQAAVDAGAAAVANLGKLIAAHVIPRPHAELCGILPPPPASR